MKTVKITYWVFTGLFAALMLIAGITDLLVVPEAVTVFNRLGYPAFLLPFLGLAKTIGVAAILIPNFPKVKEWAYAGFTFDLAGAIYSHIYVGDPFYEWTGAFLGIVLLIGSYLFYQKKLNLSYASQAA